MLKIIPILSFVFIFLRPAYSESLQPVIPLSVDSVQTHRVANSLIQIIQYNMEFTPKLVIQRLETPKLKLAQQLVIDKVHIKNKIVYFNHSAGTFIDTVTMEKGVIKFTLTQYYAGSGGGEITLNCEINANDNKLTKPDCKEK